LSWFLLLSWCLIFLTFALLAAALGFGDFAEVAIGIAKILFFVFLAFLILSAGAQVLRRHSSKRLAPKLG